MTEFITSLVALGVIYYVARPLFDRKYRFSFVPLPGGNGHGDELSHMKYEALSAIKDLELEYETGKLSREDYESMRREYEVRAIRVLENMDIRHKGNKALRRPARSERVSKGRLGQQPRGNSSMNFCPHCGKRVEAGFTFCTNCGSRLRGESANGTGGAK